MRIFNILWLLFSLTACVSTANNPPETSYEQLSAKEQHRVDSILDEFKKHHLFFLEELSSMTNLVAATARGEEKGHDHSDDSSYQDEHLDIKITRAYPDQDGKYHTPTIQLTPTKMYTYETLYTVTIGNRAITVTASSITEDKPERVPAVPDPDFVENLAVRLKGKTAGNGVISLP